MGGSYKQESNLLFFVCNHPCSERWKLHRQRLTQEKKGKYFSLLLAGLPWLEARLRLRCCGFTDGIKQSNVSFYTSFFFIPIHCVHLPHLPLRSWWPRFVRRAVVVGHVRRVCVLPGQAWGGAGWSTFHYSPRGQDIRPSITCRSEGVYWPRKSQFDLPCLHVTLFHDSFNLPVHPHHLILLWEHQKVNYH